MMGGDGTVLRAARDLVKRHLPLFGVNLGTLGYLAEVDQDHLETALDHLVLGEYITEEHMMLRGVVCHEGQEILSDVALNDIVIARSGRIHVMDLKIYVNDRFLNEYSADGMIISTPTGSTGYSMAAGGPIVEPTAKNLLLTPICPHSTRSSSYVLSPDHVITVEAADANRKFVYLSVDGGKAFSLKNGDQVRVSTSKYTTKLVRLSKKSFCEILDKKMGTEASKK